MNVSVVSDITISSLIRSCVGITELNLASTSITNGALDEILEHLKTLVFLSVENTHCSLEFIESKNSLVFSSPPNGTTRYNLRADYCDDINFVKYVDHLAVSRYPGYNVDFVEYAHSRYNVDVPDTYDYRYKTAEEEAYLDYINNANAKKKKKKKKKKSVLLIEKKKKKKKKKKLSVLLIGTIATLPQFSKKKKTATKKKMTTKLNILLIGTIL
eukprot:CAMPEP_0114375710 /NCGR_PEP_ID=MMETSP0101-20121206/36456_1 /TAXON_ID=38822 ORGANISM="Pteridomonas danica, Strain PT" /NCGR_SAMPLE_ID=MMETSP0101 /ASSEMBLY_ACC=CAM_ASM_000211 /LENGTH=213 /DNA_ID=CAMNT_0001529859 /DNA_START=457 /DNA_END=1099 /DNA_ORIENTATION=-